MIIHLSNNRGTNTVTKLELFNRKNYKNPILREYHLFNVHDMADQWGECNAYLFDICGYLWLQDRLDVPHLCGYIPGMGEIEIDDAELFEGATVEQIEHAGRVLDRYADRLRLAGLDY